MVELYFHSPIRLYGMVINYVQGQLFFSLALQPQFWPSPTSMKLSVSLQFSRSWTVGRTPWTGDQLVARHLPVHKHRNTHTHTHTQTLNIHALGGIRTHDPGYRERAGSNLPLRYLVHSSKCHNYFGFSVYHILQQNWNAVFIKHWLICPIFSYILVLKNCFAAYFVHPCITRISVFNVPVSE
jgi:hypothetical protein